MEKKVDNVLYFPKSIEMLMISKRTKYSDINWLENFDAILVLPPYNTQKIK